MVQPFPSLHEEPEASRFPTHCWLVLQASPVEQLLPSSQAVPAVRAKCRHTLVAPYVQESVVHGFPSLQSIGSCRQVPVVVSQESIVQPL
jgi:hypothetical protein